MKLRPSQFFPLICLLLGILVPTLVAQTVTTKGNKTVTIGSNNGNVTVNNYEIPPEVLKQLRALGGSVDEWAPTLVPGSQPTDFGRCDPSYFDHIRSEDPTFPPNDHLYVIAAGGSTAICSKLPCTIVNVNGKDVIQVIQLKKGLGLKATVFARDGKAIVGIDGTTVSVNQNEAGFRPKRPNPHTIEVDDQYNDEALWVSLENPHFVRLRAHYRDANGTYLDISDDKVTVPNAYVMACVVDSSTMFSLHMPFQWQP